MASARLLAKLMHVAANISAGALRRLHEGDRAKGLEAVRPVLTLVIETSCVQASPPDDVKRTVEAYLSQLVDRYGTLRRAVEALSTPHRRHASISSDKAHTWAQTMGCTAGTVEMTLKRHPALLGHIANWCSAHPEIENKLDEYERWLDGPLEGETHAPAAPGASSPAGAAAGLTRHAAHAAPLSDAKKVVPAMGAPASPIRLEDEDLAADGVSHSDVDAMAVLEDSSEQAKIAGEGSRDVKLIRLTVLHDKHPGEEPSDREITDEQRAAIERLKKDADQYARAVGAVAARDFLMADGLIPFIEDRVEPHLWLTLRGDRLYFESRYDEALPVYRSARVKRDDVVTRMNVAVTLLRATKGSLEDNFREAIDLLNDTALTLGEGTREWARLRSILGLAWAHTPTGARGKNLAEAIKCFDSAALALKRDADPHWWAETQLHLGRAWLEVATGDRAANVATALRHFESAQQVWTRAKSPHHWAALMNCVGNAHERNPKGDRQQHLATALKCYSDALEVREGARHSIQWAILQNNSANVLMQIAAGDHRQNVERAVDCYKRALEVYTQQNRRADWAATQNNLGNAYAHLPAEGDERQKNLRLAIASYRAALDVRTKAVAPNEWATTQNNLGVALSLLAPTPGEASLKEALACFRHALEVRSKAHAPVEWATTQMNLGRTHARMSAGDRAENLQEAVAYFENALEVFTADAHPHQHQLVVSRLKDVKSLLHDMGRA